MKKLAVSFILLAYFLTPGLSYGLIPASPQEEDRIVEFVQSWFSLFDQNADSEDFHRRLSTQQVYLRFPEALLLSPRDFDQWYENVRKTFQSPSHSIREIKVSKSIDGSFIVNLNVIWRATKIDDRTMVRFSARQIWQIVEEDNELKIKKYYVQEDNTFFNPLNAYLHHLKIPVYGGFVEENGTVVESLATENFLDFLWIEAEHSVLSEAAVQDIVRTAENKKLLTVVRVPKNDPDVIKRYIGTGVNGIVIPSIKTIADAQNAINAVKYPPLGQRPAGVDRSNGYLEKFNEYMSVANQEVILGLMIETKEAVENIEKILTIPGICFIHLGPYDLSLSMNVSMGSEELNNAIGKVEKAALIANIPLGSYAPNLADSVKKSHRGYRFFTIPDASAMVREGVRRFFND